VETYFWWISWKLFFHFSVCDTDRKVIYFTIHHKSEC
jgi:hypothetical protein